MSLIENTEYHVSTMLYTLTFYDNLCHNMYHF